MARVLRGDVFWADLNPARGHEQGGLRPVLILSHDVFNARSQTVLSMAITSQPGPPFPLSSPVPKGRLPKPSWVKISQVRLLSVDRLKGRIAHLSPDELLPYIEGLNEIIA